jgi:flagellar hook assembly protein FlgD
VGPTDVGGPSLTRLTAAPNPFYPVRRDRYKDTMKISFRLGKASAITISIYNSSGTLVRTVTTSRKAGAQYVLWDGKSAGGKVSTGTYYVVITATAGGKRTSAKAIKTTIRNYEVVRVSRSKLKIVPR